MQDAVKVMAKSLVRNRHAVTKMYGLKSQLQAVSLRIAVRSSVLARFTFWPLLSPLHQSHLQSDADMPEGG